jgi:hypothetical protein
MQRVKMMTSQRQVTDVFRAKISWFGRPPACPSIIIGGAKSSYVVVAKTMRLAFLSSLLLLARPSAAFVVVPARKAATTSSLAMTSAVEANPFVQPPRLIMDELPTVFVYDHCPFCVRVRLALGIKNVKHYVNFLANDDVKIPTSLVGKKIAPIFVSDGVTIRVFVFKLFSFHHL